LILTIGDRIERYEVEALLGSGAMAEDYRVRHRTLGTLHALKVLILANARIRERLILEGQVQARMCHPNVLAVTDVLDVDGVPGLLMEFVDGPSLHDVIQG
jgi:serine/threonine protein kinase